MGAPNVGESDGDVIVTRAVKAKSPAMRYAVQGRWHIVTSSVLQYI